MAQRVPAAAGASAYAGSAAGGGVDTAAVHLNAAQRARLDQVAREAALLYPDDAELQRVAIDAATDYLLGRADLVSAGAELARVRLEQQHIRARARQVVVLAFADGHSERSIAREVGVDRMNVRRWLGKPGGAAAGRAGISGDRC